MPKKRFEMSALEVKRLLSIPGMHAVGGVVGLFLQVRDSGSGSWVLRVKVGHRRRDIGLGSYPDVSMEEARERAKTDREKIRNGIDPVAERKAAQAALKSAQMKKLTFKQAAIQCHRKQSAEFKNIKHAAQWINSLKTYAFSVVGNVPVDEIHLEHIKAILDPIWHQKVETASRVRMRLEAVLSWASVSGHRSGDNPARWSGHLNAIYPSPAKLKKLSGGHHAAMAFSEVPAFVAHLRKSKSMSARALEFLILTAARSGEVRDARWSEIDLKAKVWTVPAERMKAGKEHRVPLSDAAIELLKRRPRFLNNELVFPSIQKKAALSDSGIAKPLKQYNAGYTVHGFRSTFRDWIVEKTEYQNSVAETALAHVVKNATEAAYRRGDLYDKRVERMAAWSEYCGSHKSAEVINLTH